MRNQFEPIILMPKPTRGVWSLALPLLALGLACPTPAQDEPAKGETGEATKKKSVLAEQGRPLDKEFVLREMLDTFFASVQGGKVEEAFAELLKGSKIGEKKENVDELVKNTGVVLEQFGELVDSEMIRAERVGGRVIRLTYLSYGADFPLQWQFYCYRGRENWQVLDINVNNDLEQIFGSPLIEKPGVTPK